jgi:hypothetical protein
MPSDPPSSASVPSLPLSDEEEDSDSELSFISPVDVDSPISSPRRESEHEFVSNLPPENLGSSARNRKEMATYDEDPEDTDANRMDSNDFSSIALPRTPPPKKNKPPPKKEEESNKED